MTRVQQFGFLGLLCVGIGAGAFWGLRSIPPSETQIIDAAAAAYVAETGGALTDCAARPSALERVRLVVICADGAWVAAFDTFGAPVELSSGDLSEDQT